MPGQLLTTWRDYQQSIDQVLALASRTLSIFDHDLSLFKPDDPSRNSQLRRLLGDRIVDRRMTIIVQEADFVRQHCPRLLSLLASYAPALTLIVAPATLAALRDSILIADDRHLLVRFDRQQPRARQLIDEVIDCQPYVARFAEILAEGGETISPTTLGL